MRKLSKLLGFLAIAGLVVFAVGQISPKQATFSLTVTASPDWTLAVTPATQEATLGKVAEFTVTTQATGGYVGNLTLTLAGFAEGSYTFSANPIAAGASATLTINTALLAVGTYNGTLTATEVADQPPFNTVRAESASSVDIQAAIDLALDGETVEVPAGNAVWTSNVTVPATKGISLIGAGVGATNINLSGGYYLFLDTREANSPVRVSGFSFDSCPAPSLRINYQTIGATDWRVDHCEWKNGVLGTEIDVLGYTFGVFDNCTFTNCQRTLWIDAQIRPFDTTAPMPYPGGYSWQQPVTPGGPAAVYFEDCTITNATASIFFNMRGGARVVFRHNKVTGINGLETHSGCTPGYRNPRWTEIYENTFDLQGGQYWCGLFLRSTNGVVYNNTFSAGYPTVIQFDNETTCLTSCTNPWPSANTTAYPAQDQIGAGLDTGWGTRQSTDEAKLYIWGNTQAGAAVTPNFSGCANTGTLVQLGRDYFLSAPPAYAPYAYPHPLRSR